MVEMFCVPFGILAFLFLWINTSDAHLTGSVNATATG